ncbi:right-handed parallel beta-helix repeat-containing protein [Caldithrix abyssi]
MLRIILIILTTSQILFGLSIYFVDNTAGNNGDGSFEQPFNSIAEGMSHLQTGDTLFVRGSQSGPAQIYNEELYLSDSSPAGTQEAPIVVKAYQNEQVRIILQSSFSIYATHWTFEDLIFDMDGKNYDTIKLKGDYITFRNCEITNGQKDGFDIAGASYTLIENCIIHNFTRSDQYDAHGIILDGGLDNVFRNNTIYDCKGDCIQLYNSEQNYGTLIEGNNLYTTLGSGSENAIDVKAARNLRIINNKMHGFHDSEDSDGVALKINKDSDDILVYGNEIYESNGGIRVSGGDVDSIRIERNVIHDLHVDGGDSSKYGYGIQFDGVNNVHLINNTMANIPGPLFWIAGGSATNIRMENNLFYRSNAFKGSASEFKGNVFIDFNGWFKCQEIIASDNQVTGDDPSFVDEANYDYHLKGNSPAIDAGNPATGSDFPGGRVDLGAFEYEPATPIDQTPPQPPQNLRFFNCYPNPFNPDTIMEYELVISGQVRLEIFNILGEKIDALINGFQSAGIYQKRWLANALPAGIYFARLQVNRQTKVQSLILLK